MAKRDWSTEYVNEQWWAERVSDLTPERAQRLAAKRHFKSVESMLGAVSLGIGWDNASNRWVLPCADIKGDMLFAKAWRTPPSDKSEIPKWVTAGRGNLRGIDSVGIGLLWDLPWIVERLDSFREKTLWICAGEWDTIMLRGAGLAATCWTDGETATIKSDQVCLELGGIDSALTILSTFEQIAIVFDCDEAGRRGSKLWYNTLTNWFKTIDEANPEANAKPQTRVVAIDLRQSPGWIDSGQQEGWDLTDFTVWSRKAKATASGTNTINASKLGPNWLRACVSPSNTDAIGLLNVESVDLTGILGKPVGPDGNPSRFKTSDIPTLVEISVQYAISQGSRGEGAYHLGHKASRTGWTYGELVDAGGAEAFKAAIDVAMPKDHEVLISEILLAFQRSLFAGERNMNADSIDTDLANVFRFHHYYPFFMYHEAKGKWMWWSGKCWELAGNKITDHISYLPNRIREEASEQFKLGNTELATRLNKWAKRSESAAMIRNVRQLIENMTIFAPRLQFGERWDNQPMKLATPDGVVDLTAPFVLDSTGAPTSEIALITGFEARNLFISAGSRGRLHTASDPLVIESIEFVEISMREWHSNPDTVRMLQEIFGWNLVGRNPQKFFVFYSSGRSGKSACLDGVEWSLGDLCHNINASDLLGSDNNKNMTIAGFAGKRMGNIREVGSKGIDLEILKMITGEQVLRGRKLYNDMQNIENNATIFCTTNTNIVEAMGGDTGDAMRGRIVTIPWNVTFKDPALIDLAQRIVCGTTPATEGVSEFQARRLTLDVECGLVLPEKLSTSHIMREGLPQIISAHGRNVASQAIADAWLQWAFRGWLRCYSRDPIHYKIESSKSVVADTSATFAASDEIGHYFEYSGLWIPEPDPGGTFVSTGGLVRSILEFLRPQATLGVSGGMVSGVGTGYSGHSDGFSTSHYDGSLYERLSNANEASITLGKRLKQMGSGYYSRKTGPQKTLWPTGKTQDRTWHVPFRYIGPDRIGYVKPENI